MDALIATVRVRARARDPFEGLKGADYIRACGLTPQPNRIQAEACPHCAQQEMLPAVLQICAAVERRQLASVPTAAWKNLHDEQVLNLLEAV